MDSTTFSEFADKVMPLYLESARSYVQLALAALALTITFKEKVLGQEGRIYPTRLLKLSWLALLICVATSAYYQWVGVVVIEQIETDPTLQGPFRFPLNVPLMGPAIAYGAMVGSFFVGALLLVLSSASALKAKASH